MYAMTIDVIYISSEANYEILFSVLKQKEPIESHQRGLAKNLIRIKKIIILICLISQTKYIFIFYGTLCKMRKKVSDFMLGRKLTCYS